MLLIKLVLMDGIVWMKIVLADEIIEKVILAGVIIETGKVSENVDEVRACGNVEMDMFTPPPIGVRQGRRMLSRAIVLIRQSSGFLVCGAIAKLVYVLAWETLFLGMGAAVGGRL